MTGVLLALLEWERVCMLAAVVGVAAWVLGCSLAVVAGWVREWRAAGEEEPVADPDEWWV